MSIGEQTTDELIELDTDVELLARVMRVYLPHCRYLRSATLTAGPRDQITICGEFEIGESCYIDDTGHFNSVEFNICYNQMAYYLIAKSVKDGLLDVFADWTMDDFWNRQLGNILITDFRSSFRREMRGKRFSGSLSMTDAVRLARTEWWQPLVVLRTSCEFWDETGGQSRGDVKIAITNVG